MKVKIKRVDTSLPLPKYETAGAVCFDVYVRETAVVPAGGFNTIPANLIIETPPGYALILAARSSTAHKKGMTMRNAIGIFDQDFCGPEDEMRIMLQNLTDQDITVERGERVGQAMFVKIETAEWEEVEEMTNETRGGLGSTGL